MNPPSDLALELEMSRTTIPLGGEVPYRLTLRNDGAAPADVVSLYDNNRVTNVELVALHRAPGGEIVETLVGIFNHVTRQHLIGKVEVRTEDVRPLTLPPGGSEVREDNLCRYRWFERPGRFRLRGLYRWQGLELWSEPRELEIVEAPLWALDQRWSYHYGEKFVLHTAWMVRRNRLSEIYLRESLRFSPHVVNYNPPVLRVPEVVAPVVSFHRSLLATGDVWLVWISEGEVTGYKTRAGALESGPHRVAVGLQRAALAGPPLTSKTGDLVIFVIGEDEDSGEVRLLGVHLGPDGQERARHRFDPPLAVGGMGRIESMIGVLDPDGGHHLLWSIGDTREVMHWAIAPETLRPSGDPEVLWRAPARILALCAPPVFGDDAWLSVVMVRGDEPDAAGAGELELTWLSLDSRENPLKSERMPYADAPAVLRASGEMNERGELFVLVTSKHRLRYVNGHLGDARDIVSTGALFDRGLERLTVTVRDVVYLLANERPHGLHEEILQRDDADLGAP